jgi:malonyl-CoA O-methyltransferase
MLSLSPAWRDDRTSRPAADARTDVLDAREGYRLWAPTYSAETAFSRLEDKAARALTPPLAGLRLLDAGCGTGRRLRGCGAARAVGIDLTPEMLDAGAACGDLPADVETLVADVRAMPVADRAFDVVWCRLVLGHLPDGAPAYAELARVAAPGSTLVVTDFHPDAWAAGHRRTFRSEAGEHELEHWVHSAETHVAAARAAGLTPIGRRDAAIGPEVEDDYARAGRQAAYSADLGLKVVLAMAFRRER